MKIVITHSTKFDFYNELYLPIKNDNELMNHEFYFPEENRTLNTKKVIEECDLVIAEVSYPSTGQGIELGWAEYMNKPIYCIYKKGMYPSSSLKFITSEFYEYSNEIDLQKIVSLIIEK